MEPLKKYRQGYVETETANGQKSLHNGDDVAVALEGIEPETVARAAERLLSMQKGALYRGDGTGKYDHLNLGQVRMNAGNRIRNGIKRGDFSLDDLRGALR
jgi:hypothetical protein